ncbi:MAG: hypothetical protein KJ820_16350 [Bacteroidetes bacterium]|nr:hypothetical protein [Bacteroidota bacterium]
MVSDVHIDRAIKNVALRYSNANFIAPQVAPVVTVPNESDKYFIFTKGDWFRDEADDDRRPGSRAPRGGFTLSNATFSLKEAAHATPIPDRIRDNADDPLRPWEDAARFSSQMVMLRRERRAAAALFVASTWNSGTDHTVTNQWSDLVNSDPASDIATGLDTIAQATAQIPNTLIIGREVYTQLRQHPDGLDRYKHTQTGIMTAEMIAEWLGVERIVIGSAVYNSAAEGATVSMSYIWGRNALLLYVPTSPSITEPSAAYIFQKGGLQTKRYREEAEGQDVVEAKLMHDTVRTAVDCGYYYASIVA